MQHMRPTLVCETYGGSPYAYYPLGQYLGDSADVMEWHALYRMHAQLRQHLTLL